MPGQPLTTKELHIIERATQQAGPMLGYVGRALAGIDALDAVPFETTVEAELRDACTRILSKLDTIATLRKTAP